MHTYLKKKLPWYSQWHDMWIHGPSHWVVFACTIAVISALFMYVVQSNGGAGVVAEVRAQVSIAAASQIATCRSASCVLTIPRSKLFMSPTDSNTLWAIFEKSSGNFMKSTDGGQTWSTPITIRSYLDYHASLSGDSQGNLYITDPGVGGVYFRKVNAPAVQATDMSAALTLTSAFIPAGVSTRSNVLAQDASNIWVFARTSTNATGNVRYFRSTDGGVTFSQEGWVADTGHDNVRIGSLLVNGQPAVVIWYSDDSSNVGWGYRYFIWNGSAFVANADSTIVWGSKIYQRQYAASFVDGEFHVVYDDSQGHLVHSWKPYNGGTGSWTQQNIETLPYTPRDWLPSLTRHGNTLYLFYNRQESSTAGNNNVYYRTWDTTTHTWSSATPLTNDGAEHRYPQGPAVVNADATYIPVIWVSPTNAVMLERLSTTAVPCTESWSCTAWSACTAGGTQTRTCTDANACGTTTSKPAESQSCTPVDATPPATITDLHAT